MSSQIIRPVPLLTVAVLIQYMVLISAINFTVSGSSSFDRELNEVFTSGYKISVAPSIAAVLAIVIGIAVAFFGYKLFKPVLFISGFVVGAMVGFLVAERIFKNQSYITTASWITAIICGIILGAIVICVFQLGVFLIGAAAGILLAFALNTSFGYKIWPSNPTGMLYILLVVLALLFGWLALRLERPFIIVATSLCGAIATVWGIGYFAGKYPSGQDLESWRIQLADGNYEYKIGNEWWGYMAGTILLFIIALFVQFKKTADGINHNMKKSSRAWGHGGYHGSHV